MLCVRSRCFLNEELPGTGDLLNELLTSSEVTMQGAIFGPELAQWGVHLLTPSHGHAWITCTDEDEGLDKLPLPLSHIQM